MSLAEDDTLAAKLRQVIRLRQDFARKTLSRHSILGSGYDSG